MNECSPSMYEPRRSKICSSNLGNCWRVLIFLKQCRSVPSQHTAPNRFLWIWRIIMHGRSCIIYIYTCIIKIITVASNSAFWRGLFSVGTFLSFFLSLSLCLSLSLSHVAMNLYSLLIALQLMWLYRKNSKISDTREFAVITLLVEQDGFSLE